MKKSFRIMAVLLLLPACGSGDDKPSGTVALKDVAGQMRKAICDKIFSCCSAAELVQNPDLGKDSASCQAMLDGEDSIFLADIEGSVDQGRVVYHGDKMATCLADLHARSCDQVKMPPGDMDINQTCRGVFESKVPLMGACTDYWDCTDGWCEGDFGQLRDHCAPLKPVGGDCDEGPECASRLCTDERVCATRPLGSGNICALGTEFIGQHGGPAPLNALRSPVTRGLRRQRGASPVSLSSWLIARPR
jgi:hypothetical protein